MNTCPICQHAELEGEVFCSECGAHLAPAWAQKPPAASPVQTASMPRDPSQRPVELRPGPITLSIGVTGETIMLAGRTEYVLGRVEGAEQTPDIDLGRYGARENGVSRQHALLKHEPGTLVVMDLGSTNGTQLNGARLVPRRPARVASGDELRLGRLALTITYQP